MMGGGGTQCYVPLQLDVRQIMLPVCEVVVKSLVKKEQVIGVVPAIATPRQLPRPAQEDTHSRALVKEDWVVPPTAVDSGTGSNLQSSN